MVCSQCNTLLPRSPSTHTRRLSVNPPWPSSIQVSRPDPDRRASPHSSPSPLVPGPDWLGGSRLVCGNGRRRETLLDQPDSMTIHTFSSTELAVLLPGGSLLALPFVVGYPSAVPAPPGLSTGLPAESLNAASSGDCRFKGVVKSHKKYILNTKLPTQG